MTGGKFPAIVAKEIAGEADRLEVKDKAPMVLVELLFDANILQQIKDHRTLFLLVSKLPNYVPPYMGKTY